MVSAVSEVGVAVVEGGLVVEVVAVASTSSASTWAEVIDKSVGYECH